MPKGCDCHSCQIYCFSCKDHIQNDKFFYNTPANVICYDCAKNIIIESEKEEEKEKKDKKREKQNNCDHCFQYMSNGEAECHLCDELVALDEDCCNNCKH